MMKERTMDTWRQFFKTAGTDICTVIENAILVAQTDCPKALNENRDRIAQRLFSPSFIRCGGCQAQNFVEPEFRDKENGVKGSVVVSEGHFSAKGSRDASPQSKVTSSSYDNNINNIHHHHQHHHEVNGDVENNGNLLGNFSNDDAEALTEELDLRQQTIKEVSRLKETLEDPESSMKTLIECLRRLELMDLSTDVLMETKVSLSVIPLKLHKSNDIRTKARQLTRAWKELVSEFCKTTQFVEKEAAVQGYSIDSVSHGDEDNMQGLPLPPLDEGAFTAQAPLVEMDEFFEGMDEDGNVPVRRGHDYDGERTGKQLEFLCGPDVPVRKGHDCDGDRSGKQSTGVSVAHKKEQLLNENLVRCRQGPLDDNQRKMKKIGPANDRGYENKNSLRSIRSSEIPSRPTQNLSRLQEQREKGRNTDRNPDPSNLDKRKSLLVPKMSFNEEAVRCEVSKRKLLQSYAREKDAKKQRTIQMVDPHEVPSAGRGFKSSQAKFGSQQRRH